MEKIEITVIGAGIVGLSIARSLAMAGKSVLLLEKHGSFGQEASSRNSEVIHAGIYYAKGSLRGKLCLEGNDMIYDICTENDIPCAKTGKLIVACNDKEVAELPELLLSAQNNGARGVRIIEKDEISEMEPNLFAMEAIYCPSSGIVDSHSLMKFFEAEAINNGANIIYNVEVTGIKKLKKGFEVIVCQQDAEEFSFETEIVINSAGLYAEHVASLAGIDTERSGYKTSFRKGMYFRVMRGLELFPKSLIYPMPPVKNAVGIHTNPDLSGGMRLGPHFISTNEFEYSVDPGLKQFFYDSSKKYLPFLNINDIQPDMAGLHIDLVNTGSNWGDFVIRNEADKGLNGLINLIGIGSPGLTASPAIGFYVNGIVESILL